MHIYFSGIGGTGIGPLALVAQQAGYDVSGSDKQDSQYIQYLRTQGITSIHIGQSREHIATVHRAHPIDWFVYTSALPLENPNAPELMFCAEQRIKTSKRDELLSTIINDKQLSLIAIAGTHGKTTTTAMLVWLFLQRNVPVSYILPAKTSFAEMGAFSSSSTYFVYEADEFDRNFLAYMPKLSLITGVSWDHHEIFKTRSDYQAAFRDFINQTDETIIWSDDASYLEITQELSNSQLDIEDPANNVLSQLTLKGLFNRLDAWLAVTAMHRITQAPIGELVSIMNQFPGLQRRMEPLRPNLFTDYAHTPEKIRGALSVATEMAAEKGQRVIVVYEPLTNRRQHYMLEDYSDCFASAAKVYWLPSYLAREDPNQHILSPAEIIGHLADPTIAQASLRDDTLRTTIQHHLDDGDMVVGISGGGGASLDEWLRQNFTK